MTDYAVVKAPLEFREKFERLNKEYALGYDSFTEFARDAMRRRFEEIESLHRSETGRE